MSIPETPEVPEGPLAQEFLYLENFKKAILMVAGSAVQKLMMTLAKEQEVLMAIADMAMWTYAAESTLLRVQKIIDKEGAEACASEIAIVKTYFVDSADNINKTAKDALNAFAEGDELRMMLMGLKRFTKTEPFNTKEARQQIALKVIEANKYCF